MPGVVAGDVIQEIGHAGPVQRCMYAPGNAVWHAVPKVLHADQGAAGDRHQERPGGGECGLAPTTRRSARRSRACEGIASPVLGTRSTFFGEGGPHTKFLASVYGRFLFGSVVSCARRVRRNSIVNGLARLKLCESRSTQSGPL